MRKYLTSIVLSLMIGSFMAFMIISSYDSLDEITVSGKAKDIYFIQRGMYSSKESMQQAMDDFSEYIYSVEDNMYHSYVAITLKKENASKIVKLYKEHNIDMIIKKKIIENSGFLEVLKEYDDILSKTEDMESIKIINNQVMAKYDEHINSNFVK